MLRGPHPFRSPATGVIIRGHVFSLHNSSRTALNLSRASSAIRRASIRPPPRVDCPPPIEKPNPPAYLGKKHLGHDVYQTFRNRDDAQAPGPRFPDSSNIRKCLATPGTLFVDKTRYIETLDQDDKFMRVFLRPHQFGKSTFLKTLGTYYDIANADTWEDIFRGLYIGSHPTTSRSKHLVLILDMSCITTKRGITGVKRSFDTYMLQVLTDFLRKYNRHLGIRDKDPKGILQRNSGGASLRAAFRLVKNSGHTLFVGVDEYDALARKIAFDGTDTRSARERVNRISKTERFLKNSFFGVLKEGCGRYGDVACISKCLFTGVLPAFQTSMGCPSIISADPQFHGTCGFTERQVEQMARQYLVPDDQAIEQVCWAMKKHYSGYYFAKTQDDRLEPVYNPQLVRCYLENYKPRGIAVKSEESPAIHDTNVLASIVDTGDFSMDDIVGLMAAGSISSRVRSGFGFSDLIRQTGKNRTITLSLLVYLGILARGSTPGVLQIPNDTMKENVILPRVKEYLRHQEHLRDRLGPANLSLRNGTVQPFVRLLEEFMRNRAVESVSTDKATLQGVVDMMLDPPRTRVGELRLPMGRENERDDGRFGFVDVFVVSDAGNAVILGLKDVDMIGLRPGGMGKWATRPIHLDEGKLSEVSYMDEDSVDSMQCVCWSTESKEPKQTTVGQVRRDSRTQLERCIELVTSGLPQNFLNPGVPDMRSGMPEASALTLYGFSLVAVSGRRILWEALDPVRAYRRDIGL